MAAPKLLSTKALQPAQRSRLLAAGFAVQSYDALVPSTLAFEMPASPFQAIFTSQHAAEAFLAHEHISTALPILEGVYCVGERTAQRLRKKGIHIIAVADAATSLCKVLFNADTENSSTNSKNPSSALASGQNTFYDLQSLPIYYFCGTTHLPTIPNAFKTAGIALNTLETYSATAIKKSFNSPFEVLFFYSPNGLKAFCENNTIGSAFVVAIGPTTAAAVAQHTQHYTVAKRPSFAHMLSALRADYNKEKQ